MARILCIEFAGNESFHSTGNAQADSNAGDNDRLQFLNLLLHTVSLLFMRPFPVALLLVQSACRSQALLVSDRKSFAG